MKLKELAYARSGDKGSSANIGVIANDLEAYHFLEKNLTAEKVAAFFRTSNVIRYELPNLSAFNFVLYDILDGGASLSLKTDSQGKALGQAILELEV